jgi:WD40 repeat protein
VSGGIDRTVKLWRVADGALLKTMAGHADRVWRVAFAPDGATIASSAWDNTVKLWRASDGTLLRTLEGHTGRVFSVAFAPDGQRLVSSGEDGLVRVWRLSDGAVLATLSAQRWELAGCELARGWRVVQSCQVAPSANRRVYRAIVAPQGQRLAFVDGTTLRLAPLP